MTTAAEWVAFLNARLDEEQPGEVCGCVDAKQIERDVAAKRAIIEAHNRPEHYCPIPVLPGRTGQLWTPEEGPCWTLHLLARIYSDHPDYPKD